MWPGASPTRRETGATSSCSRSIQSDPNRYRTPEGWRTFDRYDETIEVAGEDEPRQQSIRWTIWGPVMDPDHKGRLRAFRWVAHDAAGLGASITGSGVGAVDRGSLRRRQWPGHPWPELRRGRRQGPDRLDDLRIDRASRRLRRPRSRCRGPTARADGAVGSIAMNIPACWIRRAAGSGQPTPASSTATCWPGLETGTTKWDRARASSGSGSRVRTTSHRQIC